MVLNNACSVMLFNSYSCLCGLAQSLNLEHKWVGAPFAAMLRRHQSDFNDSNDSVLKIVIVLLSTSSNVVQIKYASIALQVNHHHSLSLLC